MSGWLNGVVKSISSGDRLCIVGKVRSGPPPEKEIVLSGVSAPRLGTFDGSRPSEPFAQDAREYMRRLLIGKPVIFKIDYAIPNSNRESATVYLDQRTNVAVAAIGAGWAKHRPPPAGKETQVPALADMAAAEEKAKADCLGMWTKDQAAIAAAVRQPEQKEDPKELLSYAGGAGGRVTCLAEGIVNASCIRVSVERNGATKTVLVYAAGVQCPKLGKPAQGGEAGGQDNGAAATEPYAREAKHFTEMNVLQRTCELVLAGTDKFGNLYAQITTKPEGSDASGGSAAAIAAAGHAQSSSVNLAEALLAQGLAKVVDWSASMLPAAGSAKLRATERAAKEQRLRMWTGWTPPTSSTAHLETNDTKYVGTVVEVVSGDTIVVLPPGKNAQERRISLSSLRAPRVGNARAGRQGEPYSAASKEFLRKTVIGKKVSVEVDYVRALPEGPTGPATSLTMATVSLPDKSSGEQHNVAVMLLVRGLATVQRHRADDERSSQYEDLQAAEAKAIQGKKGVHSGKDEPVGREPNDASQNANKAKQMLPHLQRGGRMRAVVEAVLSSNRLKLTIPAQSTVLAFSLNGVRAPAPARRGGGGDAPRDAEPYGDEALRSVRHRVLQREVDVEVVTCDKSGAFLGSMYIGNDPSRMEDLSVMLVRDGLARVMRRDAPPELKDAESAAKSSKLRIWESYVEPTEEELAAAAAGGGSQNGAGNSAGGAVARPDTRETFDAMVTEIEERGAFWAQRASNQATIERIQGALKEAGASAAPPASRFAVGTMVMCQFSSDKQWYRASVESAAKDGSSYDVFYVDFGNRESVTADRMRPLTPDLLSTPPLAQHFQLAYVRVPSYNADGGSEAVELLGEVLFQGMCSFRVEETEKGEGKGPRLSATIHKVTVYPKSDAGEASSSSSRSSSAPVSAQAALLQAGVALLHPRGSRPGPHRDEAVRSLKGHEDEARKAHRGIFRYGDPGSDDEL